MPLYQKLMDLSEPSPKKIQVAVYQIVKLFAGPIFKVRIRSSSSATRCAWKAATEGTTEVQKTQGRFFFAIIVAYMAKIS